MYDKKTYRKGVFKGVLITTLVFLLIFCGIGIFYIRSFGNSGIAGVSLSKLKYMEEVINRYYYKDVTEADEATGIYKGLMASLDDKYADYYTPEEYQKLMEELGGSFGGIGATLSKDADTGNVVIQGIYEDSPAEKAGLKAGDILLAADGVNSVDCETLEDFVSLVRGEIGTEVKLLYSRDGVENTVKVVRDNIEIKSIRYEVLEGDIGYVYIADFSENTADQFKAAMDDLQSRGMKGVIFDLRTNGGGLLDSVTEILDYLLPEGTTVYIEDKDGHKQVFKSDAKHFVDLPMTVLTSEYTASASEIFAGAIRDYDYGTLIGTKTFGKGIVQSTINLPDGSAMKLTTARYFTPKGECIHEVGIEPDIKLEYEFMGGADTEYDELQDNQIQKAIEVLRNDISNK